MKIYDLDLSGHSHRVRLIASLLGLSPTILPVDLLSGAHKEPAFLAKNPFGQVPVLEDGEVTLFDSNAILVYLASKYDSQRTWYPEDAAIAAQIQVWLSKAANELALSMARARLVEVFNAPYDSEPLIAQSNQLLEIMDNHLRSRQWFVADHPTIADIAMYSYTRHAVEGGVNVPAFGNVSTWLERVEALAGFVPMTATETDAKRQLAA